MTKLRTSSACEAHSQSDLGNAIARYDEWLRGCTAANYPQRVLNVGMILGKGGLGDRSFNDSGYAGLQEAQERFGIRFEEELVRERTAELRRMVNLMAGREVRMAELKDVIRQLRSQLEEVGLTPVADDPLLAGRDE